MSDIFLHYPVMCALFDAYRGYEYMWFVLGCVNKQYSQHATQILNKLKNVDTKYYGRSILYHTSQEFHNIRLKEDYQAHDYMIRIKQYIEVLLKNNIFYFNQYVNKRLDMNKKFFLYNLFHIKWALELIEQGFPIYVNFYVFEISRYRICIPTKKLTLVDKKELAIKIRNSRWYRHSYHEYTIYFSGGPNNFSEFIENWLNTYL